MGKVTRHQSISADGYAAGPNQTEERPFGEDGGDGWGNTLPIVPITLGSGARLFDGVPPLKLEQTYPRGSTSVTQVTYRVLR